jgi:hypothetical protein
VRERIQPADRLEEEMAYNLAMALWQAQRLHRYEKAATHRQIESATCCRVPIVYIGSYIGAAISMADLPQFRTLVPTSHRPDPRVRPLFSRVRTRSNQCHAFLRRRVLWRRLSCQLPVAG